MPKSANFPLSSVNPINNHWAPYSKPNNLLLLSYRENVKKLEPKDIDRPARGLF